MYHLNKCLLLTFLIILSAILTRCHKTFNNFQTRILRNIESGCSLPEHPPFGKWSVIGSSEKWSPHQLLPSGNFLGVSCVDGYVIEGSPFMNCMNNNKWSNDIGRCLKKCPPLQSTPHLNVRCYDKTERSINCSQATDGSSAEIQCDPFYEVSSIETDTTIACYGGTWNSKIPECVLACGKNKDLDNSMIIGGRVAKKGAYPWHAAIYDIKTSILICGATLIHLRVVLTAAHCITKDGSYSKNDFLIAVEKYHRQLNHPEDIDAQFSTVQEIFLPERYHGMDEMYKNDLAIVVTKISFTLTEAVRPICIDWNSKYTSKSIRISRDGYVTGWGYTEEDGKPSGILNELRVSLIDHSSCLEHFSDRFPKFTLEDKMCAGHLNKNMSVCKGDSGGGLVFKFNERFHISGVVSLGPTSSRSTTYSCDSQQYGLYTNISQHKKFLREKLALADTLNTDDEKGTPISVLNCFLPGHPQDGQWSVDDNFKNREFLPGQMVKSGTRLTIKCQDLYILNSTTFIECENGSWSSTIGNCLKTCPSLFNTTTVNVHCTPKNNSTSTEPCVNVTDGTLALFECAPFYEDFSLSRNPLQVCVDGKWDKPSPVCSPVCGKPDEDTNGKIFFPWHVGIYSSTSKNPVCSGSLINERVIVTAGHCVKDASFNLKSRDAFLVSVGGRYRTLNDPRDIEHIQTSELESIWVPESSYKYNVEGMYYQDIAILVTRRTFKLNSRVSPVCLNKRTFANTTSKTRNIYTSGWGYGIEENHNPGLLKTFNVSHSFSFCLSHEEFRHFNEFLIVDKMCNSQGDKGSMVCYGDTGAGLVVQFNDGHYYLSGVLSLFPNSSHTEGACDRQKFSVYTSTFLYMFNFILKKEADYRPQ
ncbi:uncharacterized protein LOC135137524 [Zophobas morio]|uniref:uncharacterized protein LOC135137524 n=1 Tax=Zophobas morio TaxID=2755281 RepID=UPI00308345C1